MIPRCIHISSKNHFFLFGPRQTGKSTLLKSCFPAKSTLYYDLLQSELFRRLQVNPEQLRKEVIYQVENSVEKISHVIIDEIQKVPELLDEVHSMIESNLPVVFGMSGSSARKLKRKRANMLAGRAWTYQLFPFTYQEIERSFDLRNVLRFGTLPAVHLSKNNFDREETLRAYVNTYIKEEIELEANLRNLGGFLRFLPLSAAQNGAVCNFSNIARDCGVSYHTVKSYYQILEDTLLGFFMYPFGRSIRKRMTKHPKFYFFDTGVVSALNRKLKVSLIEKTSEFGQSFEHYFICEIIRINSYQRLDLDISFYRTEKGAEVDCIIELPSGKILAIEIKSTSAPIALHCKGLYSFKHKVPDAQLILACTADKPFKINDVTVKPYMQVLKEIGQY